MWIGVVRCSVVWCGAVCGAERSGVGCGPVQWQHLAGTEQRKSCWYRVQAVATNHESSSMGSIGLDQLGIATQPSAEIQCIVILGCEHVRTTFDQELVLPDGLNGATQAI